VEKRFILYILPPRSTTTSAKPFELGIFTITTGGALRGFVLRAASFDGCKQAGEGIGFRCFGLHGGVYNSKGEIGENPAKLAAVQRFGTSSYSKSIFFGTFYSCKYYPIFFLLYVSRKSETKLGSGF